MQAKHMLRLGALLAAAAVATGAFGAHALKDLPEQSLAHWETAARYHMYHSLGLCLCGLLALRGWRCRLSAWSFLLGILLFSGSLYALVLLDLKALGRVTPIGGLCLLLGWLALAFARPAADERT